MKPLSFICLLSFIFAALLLVGCDSLPESISAAESVPANDAEEKASQITLWGERFEIFLEHAYIVADTPVEFITHATNLQTLQPRREGPMTFVFRRGTDPPIEHTEPAPTRDGIYLPTLTFPSAGQWNASLTVPVDGAEHVIDLPPFTVYATSNEVDNASAPEPIDGISFLKEQQWKIPTKTEPAMLRKVVERLHLVGNVKNPPNRTADVSPGVAGKLLAPADRDFYTIGDRVEAGDVLMRIQPPLAGSDFLTFLGNTTQLTIFEVDMDAKKAEAQARHIEA